MRALVAVALGRAGRRLLEAAVVSMIMIIIIIIISSSSSSSSSSSGKYYYVVVGLCIVCCLFNSCLKHLAAALCAGLSCRRCCACSRVRGRGLLARSAALSVIC